MSLALSKYVTTMLHGKAMRIITWQPSSTEILLSATRGHTEQPWEPTPVSSADKSRLIKQLLAKHKYIIYKEYNKRIKSHHCFLKPNTHTQQQQNIGIKRKTKNTTLYEQFQIIKTYQEELNDIKGEIRIRISKKSIQHNGQKKKDKRTKNDLQNIHIKLKIE
jgi:hypothetical protein